METGWQKRERKKQKKEGMLRSCQLLDMENWDKNEQIAQKVRPIIHKGGKVKNKGVRRTENGKRKVQKKKEKSKSQEEREAETEVFNSKK